MRDLQWRRALRRPAQRSSEDRVVIWSWPLFVAIEFLKKRQRADQGFNNGAWVRERVVSDPNQRPMLFWTKPLVGIGHRAQNRWTIPYE